MSEVTDGIGTRVDPTPVCATPRVAMDARIRAARIIEARNVLRCARERLTEADRALERMLHGGSGTIYAKNQTKTARELCHDADMLIDQAGE